MKKETIVYDEAGNIPEEYWKQRTCLICGKEFEKKGRKIYCSRKCNDKAYYLKNKETYKKNTKRWIKNNPERAKEINFKANLKFRTEKRERYNKLVLKSYYKNKGKWRTRDKTYKVLKGIRKPVQIEKECKECGSKENIKLKFEVYPTKAEEIRKAIKDKKIYYICNGCRWK